MKKCTKCQVEKPLNEFHKRNELKNGLNSWCKNCFKINRKQTLEYHKNNHLRKKYGISSIDKNQMLLSQNNCCAICKINIVDFLKQQEGNIKIHDFSVDHNHETGQIRELLCTDCNTTLGKWQEKIEIFQNAIDYLSRWDATPVELSNVIPLKKKN